MKLFKILIFSFCILVVISQTTFAQDRLRISLLTITPGAELNDVFGHSALRVVDSNSVTDHVYNYGIFPFYEPNFYFKFIKGQLRYSVEIENYTEFVSYYQQMKRGTTEQVLNFSAEEKRNIKNFLNENIKEENKYYQYDFFKDNCTTRLRDIIQKNHSPAPAMPAVMPTTFTYRNAIHQYLDKGNMYWGKLGIDILLGAKTDAVMTTNEQEFLPDNLMKALDATKNTPIVSSSNQVYELEKAAEEKVYFTPMVFSISLLLFFILINFIKSRHSSSSPWGRLGGAFSWGRLGGAFSLEGLGEAVALFFDRLLFFIVGLLGIVLIFMWFGTDHIMTKNNYNLLWASPLFIVYAFVLNKKSVLVKRFSLAAAIFLSLILCTWFFLPQQLNVALIPIVVLLVWRLAAKYFTQRNKDNGGQSKLV